jgi:HK97 family phage major capsid protein
MNLADRIKAAQEALVAKKDELVGVTRQLEATPDDDALLSQCDELSNQVEQATKSLESLQKAEKALAERAAAQSPAVIHSFKQKDAPAGDVLIKQAVVEFLAHAERKNPEQVAAERYKDNQGLQAVVKTAVSGADTSTAGWAAELVRNDTVGFIESLRAVSVYAALAAQGTAIPFGNANRITIPRRGTTNGLAGAFVGEQGVIPVGKTNFGASTLDRYKMAIISVFSKELSRVSTPQIEAVIRAGMEADTAEALDTAFLDATAAVAGVRPAGIRNNASTAAGTAGGGAAAVIADIKAMVSVMTAAKTGSKPVLIMPSTSKLSIGLMNTTLGEFLFRDELARNMLLGIPVISSTNVPANVALLIDAAHFATAFGTPEFDVSDTATLTMANADGTAPTQAMDAAGALGTAGQVLPDNGISVVGGVTGAGSAGYRAASMFQTWQVAVRMVMPISWGLMQTPASVVVARTAITW